MECTEGCLSPVRERRVDSKKPINCPIPLPSSSPLVARGEPTKHARVGAISILCGKTKAQYAVVAPGQNPFKLCDFPLVSPARLLY
jgi:hypothetical protein